MPEQETGEQNNYKCTSLTRAPAATEITESKTTKLSIVQMFISQEICLDFRRQQ
jgi:hypothetical protein